MKNTNEEDVIYIKYEGGLITDRSTLLNFFKERLEETDEKKVPITLFIERFDDTIVYGTMKGRLKKIERAFQSINKDDLKEIYELIKRELGASPNKEDGLFSTMISPTFDITSYLSFKVASNKAYDFDWYMNEMSGTSRTKSDFHFHVWKM